MPKVEYTLLNAYFNAHQAFLDEFGDLVTDYLTKGWILQGGPFVVGDYIYQAVWRPSVDQPTLMA